MDSYSPMKLLASRWGEDIAADIAVLLKGEEREAIAVKVEAHLCDSKQCDCVETIAAMIRRG